MTVMLLQNSRPLQHAKLQLFPPPPAKPTTPPRVTSSSVESSCTVTAMRYYRIWIYTCNAVLLVSVLGFAIVAGKIVVSDPKRYLVPGLSMYQPSFLYAYLALATQSGILQLIGCLGALRLNERLLNVYWLLLLVLLFGDALVGVVWIFRFDKICADLRPSLKQRLAAEYGVDKDFTTLWDALQKDFKCCGVDGVHDFVNRSSGGGVVAPGNAATQPDWWTSEEAPAPSQQPTGVPESCCRYPLMTDGTAKVPMALKLLIPTLATENKSLSRVLFEGIEDMTTPADNKQEPCSGDKNVYATGCEQRLLLWLRQSADILFVLGYCVIAFLKLCFLGILRYEIREMIQKIKILHGELRPPTLLLTDLESVVVNSPLNSPTTPHLQPLLQAHHRENGDINAAPLRQMSPIRSMERRQLHLQPPDSLQTTPMHLPTMKHHLLNDGTDSDTNSSCALIVNEDRPIDRERKTINRAATTAAARQSIGNNNYEIHELQELNRLLSRHHTEI